MFIEEVPPPLQEIIRKAYIALISGIAWDHMNVFPDYDTYLEQFRKFIDLVETGGILIYCSEDRELSELVKSSGRLLDYVPYRDHPHESGHLYGTGQ